MAEEEVIVPHAGKGGVKFSIHFADELVYAPMVCTKLSRQHKYMYMYQKKYKNEEFSPFHF